MRIAIAQQNQMLGDLAGNARSLLASIRRGRASGASLVVTPELSLCGYPPEDLLLRPAFVDACAAELSALAVEVRDVVAVIGFPERDDGACYNAAAVLRNGRIDAVYRKQRLPNYTVFDEERYFEPGSAPCIFDVDGVRCGLIICEDCWFPGPAAQARGAGAQLIIVPNGSPYHTVQHAARRAQIEARIAENRVPFIYVNRVGGQDELVFDGASFVMDANGKIA